MKAVSVILQAVLILAVMSSAATVGVPYAQKTLKLSFDSAEISNVRADMLKCSDKILDTARTGSGNRCILSVNEGKLSVRSDGIYYSLEGNNGICSVHDWALVDVNKQVLQKCSLVPSGQNLYQLKWTYPKNDVILLEGTISLKSVSGTRVFDISQRGVLLVEFDSPKELPGKTIEFTRYSASGDTAVLSINVLQ